MDQKGKCAVCKKEYNYFPNLPNNQKFEYFNYITPTQVVEQEKPLQPVETVQQQPKEKLTANQKRKLRRLNKKQQEKQQKEQDTHEEEDEEEDVVNKDQIEEIISVQQDKTSTWEQIYNEIPTNANQIGQKQATSFTNFSSCFVAVCSEIPSNTVGIDFCLWLSAFGTLSDLWIERQNGIENRSAIALFSQEEGLNNAINNSKKIMFKSSQIKIEKCSSTMNKVNDMDKMHIFEDYGIKIIPNLINHPNQQIKNITTSILHSIVNNEEFRFMKRKPHGIHALIEDTDFIKMICEKCLVHGDNEQQKEDIAFFLDLQVQSLHMDAFNKLVQYGDEQVQYQLFQNGAYKPFIRLLKHPQEKVIQSVSKSLCLLIPPSNSYFPYSIAFCYGIPKHQVNPQFFQFEKDGLIQLSEQCLMQHDYNDQIQEQICDLLSFYYKRREVPNNVLHKIIDFEREKIESNLYLEKDIQNLFDILRHLSLHQKNHDEILNNCIFRLPIAQLQNQNTIVVRKVVLLLSYIFLYGNTNTRQQIKTYFPLESIQGIIQRKNIAYFFDANSSTDFFIMKANSNGDNELNEQTFSLIVWYIEEQRMDQISQIFIEINKDLEAQFTKDGKFMIKDSINMWKEAEKMITIAQGIKDPDMINGAMTLINEGFYSLQYGAALRMSEQEIEESLAVIQRIVVGMNDCILYHFVSGGLCQWLLFAYEEFKQNKKLKSITEKTVTLVSYLSLRGALMATNKDQNHLYSNLSQIGFIKSLEEIIEMDQVHKNQKEKDKKRENNIKLQAAIGYCCLTLNSEVKLNIVINCMKIFKEYLEQFNSKYLKQESTSFSHLTSQIDSQETETTTDLLLAVGIQLQSFQSNEIRNNSLCLKIRELIIPLMHIGCGCNNSISLPQTQNTSKLATAAYHALSQLVSKFSIQQADNFIQKNDILEHVLPIAQSCMQIYRISSSKSRYYSLLSKSQNASITEDLLANALKLFESLLYKSPSFFMQRQQQYKSISAFKVVILNHKDNQFAEQIKSIKNNIAAAQKI
ncbi:MAG: hypothetical protein EZS28_017340 [Streblomastix strix]|uniref:Uncharacterized protein n=1 Tax=Streblomastix strix TaxID=222440 RepID=A0A5J4VX87_9EUKA|nr:MAG: hypothetical protein EZS28_017340 [Streblomastix strix]